MAASVRLYIDYIVAVPSKVLKGIYVPIASCQLVISTFCSGVRSRRPAHNTMSAVIFCSVSYSIYNSYFVVYLWWLSKYMYIAVVYARRASPTKHQYLPGLSDYFGSSILHSLECCTVFHKNHGLTFKPYTFAELSTLAELSTFAELSSAVLCYRLSLIYAILLRGTRTLYMY